MAATCLLSLFSFWVEEITVALWLWYIVEYLLQHILLFLPSPHSLHQYDIFVCFLNDFGSPHQVVLQELPESFDLLFLVIGPFLDFNESSIVLSLF